MVLLDTGIPVLWSTDPLGHWSTGTLQFLTEDNVPCLQAFFDKDYISSHPEDSDKITQLKDLMQEQVRCWSLFSHLGVVGAKLPQLTLCPPSPLLRSTSWAWV